MRGNFPRASEKVSFTERHRHIRKDTSLLSLILLHLDVMPTMWPPSCTMQPKEEANAQNEAQQGKWQSSRAGPDVLCLEVVSPSTSCYMRE